MVEAYQDDYGYWKVGCGACGSHSGTLHPNHKPDAKRLVIESWNRRPGKDRLRALLSEAERREKDARRVAVEDCAKVAILTANHLTILPPSVRKFPEVGGIIAARILELSTPVEEKIDEVAG